MTDSTKSVGQVLYELYREAILRGQREWGANVVSVVTTRGEPGPIPEEWNSLGYHRHEFWDKLAFGFLHPQEDTTVGIVGGQNADSHIETNTEPGAAWVAALKPFSVSFVEPGDTEPSRYQCLATDSAQAETKCKLDCPGATNIKVSPGRGG